MARRVVVGIFGFSRSSAATDGDRGPSCGRKEPSVRRRIDSSADTKARARSAPTPTCWWITCGGWSASACPSRVVLRDLERYLGILGAEVRMPLGEPWRVGKRPYGPAALSITASCLKGFYLHQAALGVNPNAG